MTTDKTPDHRTVQIGPHRVECREPEDALLIEQVKTLCSDCLLTGSQITVDPPPTSTDVDILFLAGASSIKVVVELLLESGYQIGGYFTDEELNLDEDDDVKEFDLEFLDKKHRTFISLKHITQGSIGINFLLTASRNFFDDFRLATEVCRRLNIADRDDRIVIFQSLLYKKRPTLNVKTMQPVTAHCRRENGPDQIDESLNPFKDHQT